MSDSLPKPAANGHLGKEAFALLKVGGGGLWFSQGCEPMRFYHVVMHVCYGLTHAGCDCKSELRVGLLIAA